MLKDLSNPGRRSFRSLAAQRWAPRCLGAGLALVGLECAACGSSDDSRKPVSPLDDYAVPIAGCEQFSYKACDITAPSCQANIFALVKCVRKTPNGTLPPVTTITATDYQNQLTQDSNDLNPDDLKRQETALVLLGLASPGDLTVTNQVSVLVNTVSAYYTGEEKKVYIIRPDKPATPTELHSQSLTLAHEFVHALQDQAYNLKQFHSDHSATYDANLASISVTEGEAILYETMLRAAFDGLTPDRVNYAERFASAASFALNLYSSEAPYLIGPRVFPYFYGGPYIYLQLQASGRAGVDALFASPPPASLPYIVSQSSIVDTPLNPVTDAAPSAVTGASLIGEDTLGAWLTYEFATYASRVSGTAPEPAQAVSGWRGDHLYIYGDGTTTNIAVVWRVRWSTPEEVNSFVSQTNATYVPSPDGNGSALRHAFVSGGDAVVVAVSGSFNLAAWEAAVTASAAGTSTTGSGSGADAGASAAGPIQARPIILPPVPRPSGCATCAKR